MTGTATSATVLTLLGGVGVFLFGMQVMTEALRQMASRQARAVLAGMTRSPISGVFTGAATTAAIQSSSATMVTTIGFVGAGLLTFPQAIGIVLGANIGTTITGWMVALIGLKLQLGTAALALMPIAALMRLVGRGQVQRAGLALAGFALVFLGLDMMQAATKGFEGILTPDRLPDDTLTGRLQLIAMGALVTAVIQSSSAGVAATLVLLTAGAISFPQSAALVIGMDIGTTATALLTSIGGSRAMRQTAVAHVFYNLVTGTIAFLLLGLVAPYLDQVLAQDNAALALVSFHTLFNVVAVMLMLPFVPLFARTIRRLVPDADGPVSEPLDRQLLSDADAALDAAQSAADKIASAVFRATAARLGGEKHQPLGGPAASPIFTSLDDLGGFLTRLNVPADQTAPLARLSALMHQYDHLKRMAARAARERRLETLMTDVTLRRPANALAEALQRAASAPSAPGHVARLDRLCRLIDARSVRLRRALLLRERAGLVDPGAIFDLTDALRWLTRTADHAARITGYAERARTVRS